LGCPQVVRLPYHWDGSLLQRLFSTFPDGWPGAGLLLLRFGAAIPLIYFGAVGITSGSEQWLSVALRLVASIGGLLLLLGLWTPVAGTVIAAEELWRAYALESSQRDNPWFHVVLAVVVAGVAMLGPGAWSLDARFFGRKRFEINGRHSRKDPSK
jgi:putative oxidoreductase